MQVFVTGATGYIGFAVAAALRRADIASGAWPGARRKTRRLVQHEIVPVIGDLADPKTYLEVASECALLVHTAFDYSANGVAKDRTAIDTLLEAGRRGAGPKTLIFTSGAWVYGDTGDRMVDETTPPNPPKLVAWRPAHEQMVLQAAGVRGLVVRPGDVYGGPAFHRPVVRRPSTGEPPLVVGMGETGYRWFTSTTGRCVRADRGERPGGRDLQRERSVALYSTRDGDAAARAAGYEGRCADAPPRSPENPGDLADALALNQHVDAQKVARLLGWRPGHAGFLDEASGYYRAWKAHQD